MKTLPFFTVPVLWFLSLFFSLPLVSPYEMSRLLSLVMAVAALGAVLLDPLNRASVMPRSVLALLITAFFLWCGLTYFWSVSPFVTLVAWGTLALLPLWFLIFALMPLTGTQVMATLRLSVFAGVALSIWALLQYCVFTRFLDVNGAIKHPFADPNNIAALLNIIFFAALGLLFTTTHKIERVLMMVASGVMVLAMVIIASRTALLLSVAGCILFWVLTRGATPSFPKALLRRWALMIVAAMGVALILAASVEHERVTVFTRMVHWFSAEDGSGSARFMLYASTIEMIKQYFWGGAGLGSFFLLYPAMRHEAENVSAGLMAHSDPLQFWAEAGLPAVLLLYAILILVSWRFIQYLRRVPADNAQRVVPVALFCALFTLAMHMHVSFHLFVAGLLVVTGMVLGVWARMTTSMDVKTMPVGPSAIFTLIVMAGLLVVFQTCLRSEMLTRQAVEAMERNDMQTFGDKINQANREGFGLNPRPYILASSIPLGLLQTSPGISKEEKKALFDQTDHLLDGALARAPLSAGAYFSKAMLYSAMGRRGEAEVFLEKTLFLDPRHPRAKVLLKK